MLVPRRMSLCLASALLSFTLAGAGCDVFGEHRCQPDARLPALEREVAELRDALAATRPEPPGDAPGARGGAVEVSGLEVVGEQRSDGALHGSFAVEVTVTNSGAVAVRHPQVVAELVIASHGPKQAPPRVTRRVEHLDTLAPGATRTLRLQGFSVGHPEESHVLVAHVLCPPAAHEPACGLRQKRLGVVFPPGSLD